MFKNRIFPWLAINAFALTTSVLTLSAAGCGAPSEGTASGAASSSVEPAQLLAQWTDLAKTATKEKDNIQEAIGIAIELAKTDKNTLTAMLDVLADPATSSMAKIVAKYSLQSVGVDDGMVERIKAITMPDNDVTTRLCAIELFATVEGEEVDKSLAKLATDENRRVRFVATRVMAMRDPKFRRELQTFWDKPDTTDDDKTSILFALVDGPAGDSLPIFQDAINNTRLDTMIRTISVQMLAQFGDKESLPALAQCVEKDPAESVRTAAQQAIDAINARTDEEGS